MGGGNSSEENIKKLNEANDKLSSYKNNTSDLAKLALRHLDKRIVHKHDDYFFAPRPDIHTICIRDADTWLNNEQMMPVEINCDTGHFKVPLENFPNLDCKNGEHMYVLDNHRIPLVNKNFSRFDIYGDSDDSYWVRSNSNIPRLTNSAVYHVIKCTGDYGTDVTVRNKAYELLSRSKFSYDNNVLQGSIDALGLDTAKLTEHKYKNEEDISNLARGIYDDGRKKEGFKNKRKQQNYFINNVNTYKYQ